MGFVSSHALLRFIERLLFRIVKTCTSHGFVKCKTRTRMIPFHESSLFLWIFIGATMRSLYFFPHVSVFPEIVIRR